MTDLAEFTRIETVKAVQNTPANRNDIVAWLLEHSRIDTAQARTEASVAGTISFWDGDTGWHAKPDDWIVDDGGDLAIYTPEQLAEELRPVEPPVEGTTGFLTTSQGLAELRRTLESDMAPSGMIQMSRAAGEAIASTTWVTLPDINDEEVRAMASISAAVETLPLPARKRVVAWLAARVGTTVI